MNIPVRFANFVLESIRPEWMETEHAESFQWTVNSIEELRRENPDKDIIVLLDNDGIITKQKVGESLKYPGISHIQWLKDLKLNAYGDEEMENLRRLSEMSNVCIATNRTDGNLAQMAFASGFLMDNLRSKLEEFGINVPIFTGLNKQIPFVDDYSNLIEWIRSKRTNDKEYLVVSIADIDIATPTHMFFMMKIMKELNDPKANCLKFDVVTP